jgi:hypothetical protein
MQIKSGPPLIANWIDISLHFSASSFTEIKWVAYLEIHPKSNIVQYKVIFGVCLWEMVSGQ